MTTTPLLPLPATGFSDHIGETVIVEGSMVGTLIESDAYESIVQFDGVANIATFHTEAVMLYPTT